MEWGSLKRRAKSQLKTNWLRVLGALIVIGLIPLTIVVGEMFLAALAKSEWAVWCTSMIYIIAILAVFGAVQVGIANYSLKFVNDGTTKVSGMFYGFKNYSESTKTGLWVNLFTVLWGLFIVAAYIFMYSALELLFTWTTPTINAANQFVDPLISIHPLLILPLFAVIYLIVFGSMVLVYIKIYSYSATYYIKAVKPELKGLECVRLSKKIMAGKRWHLFGLHLSFALWICLSLATFGLALFWVIPYIQVTMGNYYTELLKESGLMGDEDDELSEANESNVIEETILQEPQTTEE